MLCERAVEEVSVTAFLVGEDSKWEGWVDEVVEGGIYSILLHMSHFR